MSEHTEKNPSSCDSDCSTCTADCPSRKGIEKLVPHPSTKIKKTIAVLSGKGGVGKSMVTTLLASKMAHLGRKVAILDADVTGPSIPRSYGIGTVDLEGSEEGIEPYETQGGVKIVSSNLLMDDPTAPILWRGSLVSNLVGQMYTMFTYGDIDYMFIDMPPGTGDVPLTVFQQIKIDGAIMVTTPQELVELVVEKAVNMCKMMNVPLLGLVENMSYVNCPDCGRKIHPFGDSRLEEVAHKYGVLPLDSLPIDPSLTRMIDKGAADGYDGEDVSLAIKAIESI